MTEHEPKRESEDAVVEALRRALPTSRHAEMVFEGLLHRLGDAAVVETSAGGSRVRVFRRDRDAPSWIVPWPLLRLSRGQRLDFVMGQGPPTQETPDAREGPALRLRGVGPGEIEIFDGVSRFTATFGQDGRLAETARSASLGTFAGVVDALRGAAAFATDTLVDFILDLDGGRAGPGRVDRPAPLYAGVDGSWEAATRFVRDRMFERSDAAEPPAWICVDAVSGSAVGFGATREQASEACRVEIRRVLPRPVPPTPPPEISEEALANLGLPGGPFLISAPKNDAPEIEPRPETTPIAAFQFVAPPTHAPPYGVWTYVVEERGLGRAAVFVRRPDGFLIVAAGVAAACPLDVLESALDRADARDLPRFRRFATSPLASMLPPLDTETMSYAVERPPGGGATADLRRMGGGCGFLGRSLTPDLLVHGVLRLRRLG